jgi:hypothetical protein
VAANACDQLVDTYVSAPALVAEHNLVLPTFGFVMT